ncbi:ZYRO0G04510p [Zygosaccharomyces rouxii]|uniref:Peroxisomal ATPase PEX1 n=1 Tax=Zygosaccharomyces rouxii (strain ATCC 2623 / CBS 732 / NBRC 1130 / NCYC 568 / NRRL Y-229) TaxID=559307 RepID=C5DZH7_ZYGRC|nr:uncharacterized protein ZYRO0G04510g [Zygosaccharomyces rouxii]KAH9202260.1 P-loop containing nucleoside triphosphate hydrolase protein [Zygosaccharomyces rouxii]CAR29261.1 ZYRO0G04510p [Zygosaccharomyces rouxii]
MTASKAGELHFSGIRVVSANDIKGNFVRLPSSIVQTLESTGISIQEFGISIVRESKEILHTGWDGYESQGYANGQSTIDINPILAREFGLVMGSLVDLTICKYGASQTATEVHVEPESSDDWEIIESNSMFFQDEILHQTRIVTVGEVLICYIDNVVSKFRINRIFPETLKSARINTGSLIVIAPRENRARHPVENVKARELNKPMDTVARLRRTIITTDSTELQGLQARVHPGELESEYALVSILYNSLDMKHLQALKKASGKYASDIACTVAIDGTVPSGHIMLSPLVWDCLCTAPENGIKLKIEFCLGQNFANDSSNSVKVLVKSLVSEEEAAKRDKRRVLHSSNLQKGPSQTILDLMGKLQTTVLTHKMIFAKENVTIELLVENSGKHPIITDFNENPIGDNWQYLPLEEVKLPLNELNYKLEGSTFVKKSMELDSLVTTDLIKQLSNFLTLPVTPSSCAMLEGGSGMGKTTLLQQLAKELILKHGKYVKYVDCDSLMESSNLTRMKQFLQDCCSLCYWHGPSVLLLDNASTLFPNMKSEDPQQQAQLQRGGPTSTKLAMTLIHGIQMISRKNSEAVRVVICDKNKHELNGSFFDKHFVSETFKIKALDTDGRTNMIQFFIKKTHTELADDLQFRDIALETEGYSPLDLELLVEKMFYNLTILQSHQNSEGLLDKKLFQETLKSFTPSSLQGVKLTKSTGVKWDDIGALKAPKRLLLETLEWPVKYAPIFANCPLQLRSGVLLYGYPGCGKTLLASAVAQQCGLNFITVKGPEILDKYIGASEQNVRELFERAQSVKPCILFFDEFDSIAPKRGHDSTGVTDRIVNQLLTQMDGVEGLDGVYVLAATSRPDLIDPALLRPGRIDKSVLCNIPSLVDRHDILRAITSKMDILQGTDLYPVAQQTEGHTGADLQGLCYSAYLKAVHRELDEHEKSQEADQNQDKDSTQDIVHSVINGGDPSSLLQNVRLFTSKQNSDLQYGKGTTDQKLPKPKISLKDLLDAAKETKSSISTHELYKLRSIYDRFQDNRDGQMPNGEGSVETGTRTSLA